MNKIFTAMALVLAFAVAAGPVRADTITSVGLYGEGVTFGNDSFSTANGFAGQTYNAGEILLTTDTNALLDAWCIDLFHSVNLGGGQSLTYLASSLAGASSGNGGVLTATQAQQIAGLANYGDMLIAQGGSVDQAAGIQMAIWATEYSGVTFSAPSAAIGDEQTYLALAPNLAGSGYAYTSPGGSQGFIIATNQIPEPASIAVLAAGLFGLCALRRRPADARIYRA